MLSEPSPCVYRLVVSGASVCRVIHLADEYGMISADGLKAEVGSLFIYIDSYSYWEINMRIFIFDYINADGLKSEVGSLWTFL